MKNKVELQKCSLDFYYFCSKYIKIPNIGIDEIKDIPLIPNSHQNIAIKSFISNQNNILLKDRQHGFTSLLCSYVLWNAIYQANHISLIYCCQDKLSTFFTALCKRIFDNIDKEIYTCKINQFSRNKLKFENNSIIKTTTCNELDGYLGSYIDLLIFDEAADIMKLEEFLRRTKSSLKNNTKIIIGGTPEKIPLDKTNYFSKLYLEAQKGLNSFKATDLILNPNPII